MLSLHVVGRALITTRVARISHIVFGEVRLNSGLTRKVIIAGAGGAAHLPGMVASMTEIPVLGVPIVSKALKGLDSLLSIVQMPFGVPVGTLAIGDAGAKNAALLAIAILSLNDKKLAKKLADFRKSQTKSVDLNPLNG